MTSMPPQTAPSSSPEPALQRATMEPSTDLHGSLLARGPSTKTKPLMPLKKETATPETPAAASPILTASSHASTLPRPSTPNLHSAASSMIFERNVQEPTAVSDIAQATPAHMKTEDLIPPALDSSSLAITDDHLSPEEVEIVTHITHQPAAATIARDITAQPSETSLPLSSQESHDHHIFHTQQELDEAGPSYGTLDPNNVRRLSFISFADVVHGDQSIPAPGLPMESSFSQSSQASRPISPTRSPITPTSQAFAPGLGSPPLTSVSMSSAKTTDASPPLSLTQSPSATSPQLHGELAIETLSQALRKTASRDLGGVNRSPPTSAA